MTKQYLIEGTHDNPSSSTIEYICLVPNKDGVACFLNDETYRQSVIPADGNLTDFQVKLNSAPGAGNSYVFTIRLNESTDTALSQTISGTDTLSALDESDVAVSAGNTVTFKVAPDNSPVLSGSVKFVCGFEPTTADETILMGKQTVGSNTTYYIGLSGPETATQTIEGNAQIVMPCSGTLKKLYVDLTAAPGVGESHVYTINKGGVASSITCTVSDAELTGDDTVNTEVVAAGDLISLKCVASANCDTAHVSGSIVFVPDTSGQYIAAFSSGEDMNSSATECCALNSGQGSWIPVAAESETECLSLATKVKAIYLDLEASPGEGNSYVFTLRDDGADTALTDTISGTDTTGNQATDVTVLAESLLDTQVVPDSSPTARWARISYLLFNDPGGAPGWGGEYCGVTVDEFDGVTPDEIDGV